MMYFPVGDDDLWYHPENNDKKTYTETDIAPQMHWMTTKAQNKASNTWTKQQQPYQENNDTHKEHNGKHETRDTLYVLHKLE